MKTAGLDWQRNFLSGINTDTLTDKTPCLQIRDFVTDQQRLVQNLTNFGT